MPPFFLGGNILNYLMLPAVTVICFLTYYLGLSGGFFFDDIINIVQNPHLRVQSLSYLAFQQAMASSESGILGRPLSMLSFALNYYFNGLDPFYFKFTNVCIHLLNGWCVFLLSRLLLAAHRRQTNLAYSQPAIDWASLAICAAWLLHPLNMAGVLFVVQRMTSLSSLFTLLGLCCYVHGRMRSVELRAAWLWILAPFILFTPLAVYCKENGALLPVFLLLIEMVFFQFRATDPKVKWLLGGAFFLSVLLPLIGLLVLTLRMPEWLTVGYLIRDFSLTERLMTEARIVWFYVQLIVVPDISQLGMYHDDIAISKSLLDPVTTIAAIAGIALSALVVVLSIRRYPVAVFGVLFFLIGHSIESTVIALELVHEHRNYLPTFGLLFSLFYYLLCPLHNPQSLFVRRIASAGFIIMLAGVTTLRASEWGDPVQMKIKEVERHPNSIRANLAIGSFYAVMPASSTVEAEDFYRRAYAYYAKAAELAPSDTLGLFGLIELNARNGLPIEDAWVSALAGRIERHPFSPSTGNSLASLEKCVSSRRCKVSPDAMEQLIQAALKNPTLRSRAKIQILFAWSDFLFSVRGDVASAVREATKAADANLHDLDNQITLINMLINMDELSEAQLRIAQVRQFDQRKTYTTVLDEREGLIADLRVARNKNGS